MFHKRDSHLENSPGLLIPDKGNIGTITSFKYIWGLKQMADIGSEKRDPPVVNSPDLLTQLLGAEEAAIFGQLIPELGQVTSKRSLRLEKNKKP